MKKGFIWYFDLILAMTIFMAGTLLAVNFIRNSYILSREKSNDITFAASSASENLVGGGIPWNWNTTNVIRFGITSNDYIINSTKLGYVSNLTVLDYERTKLFLGTRYDYLFYFMDKDNNLLNISGIYFGKPGVDNTNVADQSGDLITISRYLVLKKKIGGETDAQVVRMVFHMWK